MVLIILVGTAAALFLILFTVYFLQSKKTKSAIRRTVNPLRLGPQHNEGIVPRRAEIIRNQRNRLRSRIFYNENGEQERHGELHQIDAGEVVNTSKSQKSDEKIGTKKKAKIEAKEAKRRCREEEIRQRENRKIQEAKLEEERQRELEKQIEESRKQDEVRRLAHEELVRKEHEVYLAMKESFNIEEEGFDETEYNKENTLAEFINYIKNNKVVDLENLAAEFKLKTQQIIERIRELQSSGQLTGVIDDRGKFIYISEVELCNIAKFIKQRGRVAITEIAECSNTLIRL